MTAYRIHFTQTVADIDGNLANVRVGFGNVDDTTTLAMLATSAASFGSAVGSATNGKAIRGGIEVLLFEAQILPGSTPPTDATYPSVTDGARLNFSNSAGSAGHITIPAPKENVFLAAPQRDFVDPAGSASGLITYMKANASDVGGNLLNLYQGGIKVGRGARKRRPPKAGLS